MCQATSWGPDEVKGGKGKVKWALASPPPGLPWTEHFSSTMMFLLRLLSQGHCGLTVPSNTGSRKKWLPPSVIYTRQFSHGKGALALLKASLNTNGKSSTRKVPWYDVSNSAKESICNIMLRCCDGQSPLSTGWDHHRSKPLGTFVREFAD